MRKFLFIGVIALLICGIVAVDRIQSAVNGNPADTNIGQNNRDGMIMSQKGKLMRACPLHALMMHNLMIPSMIATEDSEIIVMAAGKLMKYDENLTLIKEVDIKFDVDAMYRRMGQITEKCPMCQKATENTQP